MNDENVWEAKVQGWREGNPIAPKRSDEEWVVDYVEGLRAQLDRYREREKAVRELAEAWAAGGQEILPGWLAGIQASVASCGQEVLRELGVTPPPDWKAYLAETEET